MCSSHYIAGLQVGGAAKGAEPGSKHERIKAFVRQSNALLERRQFADPPPPFPPADLPEKYAYANFPPPPPLAPVAPGTQLHTHQHLHQHTHVTAFVKPAHAAAPPPHHPHHAHRAAHPAPRPASLHEGGKMAARPAPSGGHLASGPGGADKMAAQDLKAFQEQQHKGRKFGLNGEFEVVGVV